MLLRQLKQNKTKPFSLNLWTKICHTGTGPVIYIILNVLMVPWYFCVFFFFFCKTNDVFMVFCVCKCYLPRKTEDTQGREITASFNPFHLTWIHMPKALSIIRIPISLNLKAIFRMFDSAFVWFLRSYQDSNF